MKHLIYNLNSFFKIDIDYKRNFGLDILRAIAILFVLFVHSLSFIPPPYNKFFKIFAIDGVSLFFVLSGFLIGGIFLKSFNQDKILFNELINFWKRRWLRTLPNYYLILIFLAIVLYLNGGFDIKTFLKYVFFSQNLFYEHPRHFFTVAWSLSIEEWFYIMFPILIGIISFVFNKKAIESLIVSSILFIVVIVLIRYFKVMDIESLTSREWDSLFRKQVVTRLDSIIYGVIAAFLYKYNNKLWNSFKEIKIILGIFIIIISRYIELNFEHFPIIYHAVFSFIFISIGWVLMFPYVMSIDFKNINTYIFKFFTIMSLISYSLYLIHLSVVKNLMVIPLSNNFKDNLAVKFLISYSLYWLLSILLSLITYKYYELPILKFRDRSN